MKGVLIHSNNRTMVTCIMEMEGIKTIEGGCSIKEEEIWEVEVNLVSKASKEGTLVNSNSVGRANSNKISSKKTNFTQ